MQLVKPKVAKTPREKTYTVGKKPAGKPAISPEREAAVLARIKKFLEIQKEVWWRRIDTSGKVYEGRMFKSPNTGMPDLVILTDGLFYGIEVKRPWGGKITDAQCKVLCEIAYHGGIGCVVCSLEGFLALIKEQKPTSFIDSPHGSVPVFQ